MSVPAAPGITQVVIDWLHDDTPIETILHYRTGDLDNTQLDALSAFILGRISSVWMAGLPSNVGLVRVRARALNPLNGPEGQAIPSSSVDGTAPGDALPNNVSFAVKKRTALSGRMNRGRLYWPGLTASMLSGANEVIAGFASDIVDFCNTLSADVGIAVPGGPEVVYHRSLGTGTDVTTYTYTDLFLDSQRRRLPGHNIHH